MGFTCPRLAEQAETLTRRLVARLAEWPWRPRPIHGDFYAPQVLLSDGSAAVIDLDRAALGDPSVDLGTFLAHLEREVCAGRLPDGYSTQMTDALLEGYGRGAERPGTEDVTTQAAAALLRLAQQPFREREPDWPTQTAALLTRAEDLLDERTRFVSLPAGHSRTRVWNPW